MEAEFLKFGSICGKYSGETALLRNTYFSRFTSEAEACDFALHIQVAELPPIPQGVSPVYETAYTAVYQIPDGWHRRCSAKYGERMQEYAVLEYSDRKAALTISPACRNPSGSVESDSAFEHLALCAGGFLLHASHISVAGESIIFSAASGVGKSTQAALWERYRNATIVNGDKSLLIPQEQTVLAAGLPYAGTSGICNNLSGKLRAVVFLEQGKENEIYRLQGAKAVLRLMSCAIRLPWHPEDLERCVALAEKIAETVPIYSLRCLPDESAVACLENIL